MGQHSPKKRVQWIDNLLPPGNVVCEGYVFTPVCDSVKRGGMRGEGGYAWQRGGMHGEGGVHRKGGACTAKGDVCGEGGMHAWRRWGGVHGMHAPLRDMACQCAGGTHPTGMHSCFIYYEVFGYN